MKSLSFFNDIEPTNLHILSSKVKSIKLERNTLVV